MTREEAYDYAMRACDSTWNNKVCADIRKALEQEPCDAISRQAAIDCFNGKIKLYVTDTKLILEYLQGVVDAIKDLPSVIPKQRTGHWIEDDMTYCGVELTNYKCDKCGEIGGSWRKGLKPNQLPKYCQWCGAKMEEQA